MFKAELELNKNTHLVGITELFYTCHPHSANKVWCWFIRSSPIRIQNWWSSWSIWRFSGGTDREAQQSGLSRRTYWWRANLNFGIVPNGKPGLI